MTVRIIGIDLAVTASHRAIVLDLASNSFVSKLLSFHANPAEMNGVLQAARANAPENVRLVAVLEATAMSWFPVSCYLLSQGVEVYRVTGQQTADQRRVYQRHAKSDRIDARLLARLYVTLPERLHRLHLPSGWQLELQRACRERLRLTAQIAAIKNRLLATDRLAWLELRDILPPYEPAARWIRNYWYNPWRVLETDAMAMAQAWRAQYPTQDTAPSWLYDLRQKAAQVVALYGAPQCLDYERLQASVVREQARLAELEAQLRHLRLKVIRPLYRQLHPQRHLETLYGVGPDSAAIYVAFIGDVRRFPSLRQFRGWSGLIPFSDQSGNAQAKGWPVTQSGPDPIKTTAFLDANIARLYDPQIAAVYHDQMVNKGKHHLQAICACATHLLDRVYVILHENRPYELRDVDGTPIDARQARQICKLRYQVPEETRRRNNYRVRMARAQRRVEQRYQQRERKQRSKG